jgi:hypothetical protein
MADAAQPIMSDWSDEETDDPIHADRRNFYKVEKWRKDVQRVVELLFAGSGLEGPSHLRSHDQTPSKHLYTPLTQPQPSA